jgi:hypothetical protein
MCIDMTTLDIVGCSQPLASSSLSQNEAEATAALFKTLAAPRASGS